MTLLRMLYGFWCWIAMLVAVVPTMLLVAVVPGEARRRRIARQGARLFFALAFVRVRVLGRENLPRHPCVVVANHASYLDGIILTAVLPPQFAFVIKREMASVPLAGFLLRRVGSEFVERFDPRRGATDARRVLARAALQESIAFFPEGTFAREPGLRRFHAGAFAAAVRGGVPVVPVAIRGSRAVLPSDAWLPRAGRLEVVVLPELRLGTHDDPVGWLLAESRRSILTALPEPDLAT